MNEGGVLLTFNDDNDRERAVAGHLRLYFYRMFRALHLTEYFTLPLAISEHSKDEKNDEEEGSWNFYEARALQVYTKAFRLCYGAEAPVVVPINTRHRNSVNEVYQWGLRQLAIPSSPLSDPSSGVNEHQFPVTDVKKKITKGV